MNSFTLFEFKRLSLVIALVLVNLTAKSFADTPAKTATSKSVRSSAEVGYGDPLVSLLAQVQPKMVKIYGAGGMRGLESYQSGFLISDDGHIATSWSTVLDSTKVRVILSDGLKADAELVGIDPQTEIAVLKIQEPTKSYFALDATSLPSPGDRVFGLSNLFGIATGDESVSAQRGVVMAIAPLSAKRGRMKTLYQGRVLVLDVMTNNPGATGGAIIDLEGRLVGMLGKELRDDQSNMWLNYALPMDVVTGTVRRILEGKTNSAAPTDKLVPSKRPHRATSLGFNLLPDVLAKTPPFVDQVTPKSIAQRSGLQPNDLILLLNEQRVDSRRSFEELLATIDRADNFSLLVQRGQELVQIDFRP
jgi:serine protease Do